MARSGVGIPVHTALGKVIIVPLPLGGKLVPDLGADAAGGKHGHPVPDLGDLAEHYGGTALYQHIRCIACAGVGGDAGKCVAAAALHTDEQLTEGQLLPVAQVQLLELLLRHVHDRLHHGIVTLPVLQS